jgi:hypothetical protein
MAVLGHEIVQLLWKSVFKDKNNAILHLGPSSARSKRLDA